VAGTVRVINTPPGPRPTPTILAEEELRIGVVEGEGPASFGRIRTIAPLEGGRIAVADALAEEVRIFDGQGRHLRTFGGKGGGPGELQGMHGVYADPHGLLRVPERENARMSIFHPDSGFVASYPFRLHRYSFQGPWEAAFDSAGRTLVASAGLYGEGRYWQMLRVYDTALVQVDSVPYYDYTDDGSRDHPGVWKISAGRGTLHVGVPFYPMPQEVLSPAGEFWTTAEETGELQLARWTPPGDTTLVLISRRPPSPVSSAERDSASAAILDRLEGSLPSTPNLDESKIPSFKPQAYGLSLDEQGRIWVRITGPGAVPTLFDLFEGDGTYTETVSLPFPVEQSIPPMTRGDTLWAVAIDEFDVQYVVRALMRPLRDR
jgi:hypothetical protein